MPSGEDHYDGISAADKLRDNLLKHPLAQIRWQSWITELSQACRTANDAWWRDPATGQPITRNKGELLMLTVTELAESMEGVRKDRMDDKLPWRKMEEVELADCLIRIFDYAGGFGLDVGGAFVEKMAFNAQRADHKPENRLKPGGKKL